MRITLTFLAVCLVVGLFCAWADVDERIPISKKQAAQIFGDAGPCYEVHIRECPLLNMRHHVPCNKDNDIGLICRMYCVSHMETDYLVDVQTGGGVVDEVEVLGGCTGEEKKEVCTKNAYGQYNCVPQSVGPCGGIQYHYTIKSDPACDE